MHEQGVIDLQQGLAVFRQAMTIHLQPEAKRRQYTQADFSPLKTHYNERTFQIHVMNEYARLALTKISGAWQYVASYFNDDKEQFVKRFFPDKDKFLERATSKQSYQRIIYDLKNPSQEKIVSSELEKNILILAGPGAGKTRVVAHRVAFLLRVKRIIPKAILVLCFNRTAVLSLRQRLRDLVGDEMVGVTMLTFHGLALRLTGRSLVTKGKQRCQEDIDFSQIIKDAIQLLKGETEVIGLQEIPPDYALLGRFSHILVDEYQDIDADQYELVSLIAGKSREENERKMSILAVGDDDQNIYRFRGASTEFIKRFQHDYDAEIHYLIENYRSTANIIAAANCLISYNTDRMKTGHPIRINHSRQSLPLGGNWQLNDPLTQGKVQILEVKNIEDQAIVLLEQLQLLRREGAVDISNCAVLAREWKELDLVRSACDRAGLPVSLCWGHHGKFPRLSRIRENAEMLERLHIMRTEMVTGTSLLVMLSKLYPGSTVWSENLKRIILDWVEETNDTLQPVPTIEEYLYEALSDQTKSKNIGNGLFLSTAHSVKGLEFDHVFILGDNWGKCQGPAIEDDRRLYYVSMSRARETLHLFSIGPLINPHTCLLAGEFLISRKASSCAESQRKVIKYELLGMDDFFIDFAGIKPENHPSRLALRGIKAGDALNIKRRNSYLELVNSDGIAIARLSKKAQAEWSKKLEKIQDIHVVALVRRYKEDVAEKEFQVNCIGGSWEVPIVEIIC